MRRLIIGLTFLVVLAGVGQAGDAIAGNTPVVPEPNSFTLLGIGIIVVLASAWIMGIPLTRNGLLLGLVISLAIARPVVADTIVGGFINSDTHWVAADSPYIATQSVVVTNSATLTIDPGVEIRFDPLKALSVAAGQLIARGTENNPIRFTTTISGEPADSERWGYIGFGDDALDATFDVSGDYTSGSILEHSVIEYAGGTDIFGALSLNNAAPYISNCTVQNNANGGIYGDYALGVRIRANNIQYNTTDNLTFRTSRLRYLVNFQGWLS